MGMFDKDRLYGGERLDKHVTIGTGPADSEHVALLDAAIVSDEVPTDIGLATKTALVIGKLNKDGTKIDSALEVNTLASAIGDKVRTKSEGDLPAVVCFFVVPSAKEGFNDATVMQFVKRWDGAVPEYTPLKETLPI